MATSRFGKLKDVTPRLSQVGAAVRPSAWLPPLPGTGVQGPPSPFRPVDPSNYQGGADYTFLIGIASPTSSLNPDGAPIFGFDPRYPRVNMELPPARRSFHEKQGQQIPGIDAGFTHTSVANIVGLAVPAGRVIYQHLGVKKECIEFVGAFCGFDNYENDNIANAPNKPRKQNAWAQYMDLKYLMQPGREVIMQLRWHDQTAFEISYAHLTDYHGYVEELEVVYATEQRIYYRVYMELNNKEDILISNYPKNKGYMLNAVPLPPAKPVVAEGAVKNLLNSIASKIGTGGTSGLGYDSPLGGAASSTDTPDSVSTINNAIRSSTGFTDTSHSNVQEAQNSIRVINRALSDPKYSSQDGFKTSANAALNSLNDYVSKANVANAAAKSVTVLPTGGL